MNLSNLLEIMLTCNSTVSLSYPLFVIRPIEWQLFSTYQLGFKTIYCSHHHSFFVSISFFDGKKERSECKSSITCPCLSLTACCIITCIHFSLLLFLHRSLDPAANGSLSWIMMWLREKVCVLSWWWTGKSQQKRKGSEWKRRHQR